MCVDGHADVVRRRAILEREYDFGNQLGRVWTDHVAAEKLIGAGVSHELHEPRALSHRSRAAVGGKRKFRGAIFSSTLLYLTLGKADDRNLRPRVYHARYGFVMHVRRLAGNHLRGYNALFQNPGHGRHWLKVKLVGTKTNRSALGARIQVELKGPDGALRSIYRVIGNNGSFGWFGAYGSQVWINPTEQLVTLLMIQNLVYPVQRDFEAAVLQARQAK